MECRIIGPLLSPYEKHKKLCLKYIGLILINSMAFLCLDIGCEGRSSNLVDRGGPRRRRKSRKSRDENPVRQFRIYSYNFDGK